MISFWLWMAVIQVVKFYNMSLSVKEIGMLLLISFVLSVPVAHILLKVGLKCKGYDYQGTKTKMIIAGSLLWILVSSYIMVYFVNDILKFIKNFV